MSEIERELGSVHGVQVKTISLKKLSNDPSICKSRFHEILFYTQVRAEAWVNEFFYNNTQRGFCETRIINQTLSLRFVGTNPMVFKPGMPFEAQIAVRYHDQVSLTQEQLGN